MNLAIPTKRDFQENREQAENALLEYVALVVFADDENGRIKTSIFLRLWYDGLIDLNEFWLAHGEIEEHPLQFVQFCDREINQKMDDDERKDLKVGFVKRERENMFDWERVAGGDDFETSDNSSEEDDEPFQEDQEDRIEALIDTEKSDFEKKLQNFIDALPEKESNKFTIFFLSTKNFVEVNAAKSPTDWPSEAYKLNFPSGKRDGSHLTYEKKKEKIWKLYPFWKIFDGLYGKKYIVADQRQIKLQYKQLFKKAKFHKCNSSREKEYLVRIIDSFFDSLQGGYEDYKDPLIKSIHCAPLQTSLQDLPKVAQSARDKMLCALPHALSKCSEYHSTMMLLVAEQVSNKKNHIDSVKLKQYREHRKHCLRCQTAENNLRMVMEYRYGRLQEIMNKPIYPVHKPNNGQINATTPQKLVQYYKEQYDKIHCELHKYYLALAYKQNDEIEKAKDLLTSNSVITPSANLTMGTVISVYCACGKEDEYHLNALRSPKVAIGRLDEENPLNMPQIGVCEPDRFIGEDGEEESAMSRNMLAFEYQAEQQNWWVQPNEGKSQEGHLWLLRPDRLFPLLKEGNLSTDIDWEQYFEQFTGCESLSDIVGIGIFKTSTTISFKGKPLESVFHPLLGKLPFGWYIEVKAQRRNKTMLNSYAENSYIE